MAGGETAMVRELPRQPGQQDSRWIHLLGPVEAPGAGAGPVPVDRESMLASGPEARDARSARRMPRLPCPTPSNICDELAGLPFESWLLRRVVDLADGAP